MDTITLKKFLLWQATLSGCAFSEKEKKKGAVSPSKTKTSDKTNKQAYFIAPPGMTENEFENFIAKAQAEVDAGTITVEQFNVVLKRKGGRVIYK